MGEAKYSGRSNIFAGKGDFKNSSGGLPSAGCYKIQSGCDPSALCLLQISMTFVNSLGNLLLNRFIGSSSS